MTASISVFIDLTGFVRANFIMIKFLN